MAALTEPVHSGEFIFSEAPGQRSRSNVTLITGQKLAAGAVLSKITIGAATAAAVGSPPDTISAVTTAAGVQVGVYQLECITAGATGKFNVIYPSGVIAGVATVGSAFTGGGLGFTITDVGGHCAVGDQYTITVAAGSGKYTGIVASAADGSNVAAGILIRATDATSADVTCPILDKAAEVSTDNLTFGVLTGTLASGQIATAVAQLAALGIITRNTI